MMRMSARLLGQQLVTGSLVVFGLLLTGSIQAAVIDFNSAGDLNANFFGANSSGATSDNYVEADGIGIGGTRAIDTIGTGTGYTTLISKLESYSLANVGDSLIVSAFAKRQNDSNINNNSSSFLRVGVTDGNNNANNRLTGGTGNGVALDAFVNLGSPASDIIFRSVNKSGGAFTYTTLSGGVTTLTSGNWYKLTATFTNEGSNVISVSGTLDDYGTDGLSFLSTVRTIGSTNLTNAGLSADTTVYGAVLARGDSGANALDNFSVTTPVPEPTTWAMLLGGGALLAWKRKRTV